jgi:hypothetical protein
MAMKAAGLGSAVIHGLRAYIWEILAVPLLVLVLILDWIFLVPIPIPTVLFHSPFLEALERSNAKIHMTERNNITADAKDIASFLPKGLTIKDAELFLRSEWFYCGPFKDLGAAEAARWGNQYRHFKVCERMTYFHPLMQGGWKIELFADRDDVVDNVRALRYYEGI